jgi:tetratricopeptide (TPR) repeat protein
LAADESRIAHVRGRDAVALGKRLIRKYPHSPAGYELAARGYEDLGRPKRALRILENGAARNAANWRFLESLAVRYSDQSRLEEALALLDQALTLAPDCASLSYNRALVLAKMNETGAALEAAYRALETESDLSSAALLAAAIESAAGRLEDARTRLDGLIDRLREHDPPDREDQALSDAYRALAEIELAFHRRERALDLFWRAVAHEKHNAAARYWIRELAGERSLHSRYWRVVVRGRWAPTVPLPAGAPPTSDPCFEALYDVVAESEEEALQLILPFEPPDVRPSVRIDSAKVLKRSVGDPKGVYRTGAYHWFN